MKTPIARFALPTIGVYLCALTAFILSALAGAAGWIWIWDTVAINTAAIFVMFTVVHEAVHYLVGSARWVNALVGRLAFIFVTPVASFPAYRYVHLAHHRYVNDDTNDPDAFAARPLYWPFAELFYAVYYLRRWRTRPKAEYAETAVLFTVSMAGLTLATVTGHLWQLAAAFLIPQRLAITLLGWSFDWLPHHGLECSRYRATRLRVGMEWLCTPLMLSQNYHLVHHLYPARPFYHYGQMWRDYEEACLQREVPIATVFGQHLNSAQYREWKAGQRPSVSERIRHG
jgi:fatty acid desaturase